MDVDLELVTFGKLVVVPGSAEALTVFDVLKAHHGTTFVVDQCDSGTSVNFEATF